MGQTEGLPGFVQKQLERAVFPSKRSSSDPKVSLKLLLCTSSLVPAWEPLTAAHPHRHPPTPLPPHHLPIRLGLFLHPTSQFRTWPGAHTYCPGSSSLVPRDPGASCLCQICAKILPSQLCVLLWPWAVFFHLPLRGHVVSEDDSPGGAGERELFSHCAALPAQG